MSAPVPSTAAASATSAPAGATPALIDFVGAGVFLTLSVAVLVHSRRLPA